MSAPVVNPSSNEDFLSMLVTARILIVDRITEPQIHVTIDLEHEQALQFGTRHPAIVLKDSLNTERSLHGGVGLHLEDVEILYCTEYGRTVTIAGLAESRPPFDEKTSIMVDRSRPDQHWCLAQSLLKSSLLAAQPLRLLLNRILYVCPLPIIEASKRQKRPM